MNDRGNPIGAAEVLEGEPTILHEVVTHARGPEGSLPITAEMLVTQPSGNLFGARLIASKSFYAN